MLQLFRNNHPYTVLILLILTLLLNMQVLLHPAMPIVAEGHFVFAYIVGLLSNVLGNSAFLFTLVAIFMQFAQALVLNTITNRHRLFSRGTYLPAFVYLLLTSISPFFGHFSEPMIIIWFLLAAFNAILTFHQTTQPRRQIYNAGFWLGLMPLVHFPSIGFFLFLIIALLILRPFNAGEWIVALLGYVTPIYFMAGILFLADALPLIKELPVLGFSLPRNIDNPAYLISSVTGSVLLLVAGLLVLQKQIPRTTIFVRRSWIVVALSVLIAAIVALFTEYDLKTGWLLVMPALSLLMANAFIMEKNKRFSNFIFYFSLLFVIICQVTFL